MRSELSGRIRQVAELSPLPMAIAGLHLRTDADTNPPDKPLPNPLPASILVTIRLSWGW